MSTKKARSACTRSSARIKYSRTQVMTPAHPRWREFCDYLGGPDFCAFRLRDPNDPLSWTWNCDSRDKAKPFCRTILKAMGGFDIAATLAYFDRHGGHCDCEVLFNVDQ